MVVSLAGCTGACYRNTFLIWVLPICVFVMFFIITTLLGFFIFAYVVTDKVLGSPVLNRAYSGCYLQDCSGWLKDRVASDSYWHKISSCTRDSKVCGKMGRSINGVPETETVDLPGHNFPHPSLGHFLEPLLFLPKFIQKPHLKRKKKYHRVLSGFTQVARVMGRPVGSTGFCRVVALNGLLTNQNRSSHRVLSRPVGPV
jgi:hypothetical protein